ncbi:MAG: CPBP family glutamic-type intramembrane protease [Pseudomonadota bacterium]
MTALVLIAAGVSLPLVFSLLVPFLTGHAPGGLAGYFTALAIYWAFFCVPVAVMTQGVSGIRARLSLKLGGAVWVPIAVLVPAAVYLVYALTQGFAGLPAMAFALGIGAALINAPLEEMAWRGAYLAAGRWNVLVQGIGVWLFAFWHWPLTQAENIVFGASAPQVLASTFILGAIWAAAAFATNSVAWPIIGHLAFNMIALPSLIAANATFD